MVVAVVQLLSRIWLLVTPWTAALPGFLPVLHYLPEFAQIHVHWVSDATQPFHPLLPFFFPSIRIFSSVTSLCIRRPRYGSFHVSRHSFTNSRLPEFCLCFNNHSDPSICGVVCWAQCEALHTCRFTWPSTLVDFIIIPISQLRKLEHQVKQLNQHPTAGEYQSHVWTQAVWL